VASGRVLRRTRVPSLTRTTASPPTRGSRPMTAGPRAGPRRIHGRWTPAVSTSASRLPRRTPVTRSSGSRASVRMPRRGRSRVSRSVPGRKPRRRAAGWTPTCRTGSVRLRSRRRGLPRRSRIPAPSRPCGPGWISRVGRGPAPTRCTVSGRTRRLRSSRRGRSVARRRLIRARSPPRRLRPIRRRGRFRPIRPGRRRLIHDRLRRWGPGPERPSHARWRLARRRRLPGVRRTVRNRRRIPASRLRCGRCRPVSLSSRGLRRLVRGRLLTGRR
jgi:hypothetical protein